MNRTKLIQYIKVSVLSDLLIQYIDDFAGENKMTDKLKSLEKDLVAISDIMYQVDHIRKNKYVQEIQNKIDTIIRKTIQNEIE